MKTKRISGFISVSLVLFVAAVMPVRAETNTAAATKVEANPISPDFVSRVQHITGLLEKNGELEKLEGASESSSMTEGKYRAKYDVVEGTPAYITQNLGGSSFLPKWTYETVLAEAKDEAAAKSKWQDYKAALEKIAAKDWKKKDWKPNAYENYKDDYNLILASENGDVDLQLVLEPVKSGGFQVRLNISLK